MVSKNYYYFLFLKTEKNKFKQMNIWVVFVFLLNFLNEI